MLDSHSLDASSVERLNVPQSRKRRRTPCVIVFDAIAVVWFEGCSDCQDVPERDTCVTFRVEDLCLVFRGFGAMGLGLGFRV